MACFWHLFSWASQVPLPPSSPCSEPPALETAATALSLGPRWTGDPLSLLIHTLQSRALGDTVLHRVFNETSFFGFSIIPSLWVDNILVGGEVDCTYIYHNLAGTYTTVLLYMFAKTNQTAHLNGVCFHM